ncbi:MAG: PDZ domain-containing protein [Pyrinomonadaceae bacterium]|nr:PDZ domain-containing protein [Pyrinomonadaceae bacterium]
MFKASNLFALLALFVLVGVSAKAQNPLPQKERIPMTQGFEIFDDGGGSYLGVQTQEVTKENFSKLGLSSVRGVAIEKVMEDSPAKQAGLQDGDVIVRFNGEEVSSYRKLTRLIGETDPDHQAKITVVRGGSEKEVTVTIGKRQAPKFEMGSFGMVMPKMPESRVFERRGMPEGGVFERSMTIPDGEKGDVFVWEGDGKDGNFVFGSTRQIGVGVSSLTKQLGDYFGIADGKGILINNVNENSPAAKAGLKAGDVIVEVEGKAVTNTMDLIRGISEKKEGDVTLTILRNRNRQTVKVTPEKMKESDTPFKVFGTPGGSVQLRTAPQVRMGTPAVKVAPARVKAITRVL